MSNDSSQPPMDSAEGADFHSEPDVAFEALELGVDHEAAGSGDEDVQADGYLCAQAREIILSTRKASVSSIQRRLRLGYNHALRIMEMLQAQGVVGPENGSSPREILVGVDSPAVAPLGGVVEEKCADVPSLPGVESEGGAGAPPPVVPPVASASGAEDDGGLPPDPADAFESKAGVELYYFDEAAGCFWVKNDVNDWVNVSEGGFKRHLKKHRGLRDKANLGKAISPLDEEVSRVEKNCRVAYAGLLAGYKRGIHMVAGRRVLVIEDPILIEPAKGEWPVLACFFEGLLCGKEPGSGEEDWVTIDQRDHFFAWLRHVVECLRSGRIAPGLAVGLAGEPDCGKSFLALVLRWTLGGRVGKPYAAMTGQDNFNKDAAEAVLQLVDDENQSDTRLDMRQKFASEIKKFNANNEFRLRSMHKDGFAVEVLRRLVILVNMQGIMVLPPLDGDVDDKIMLFKGYARPRPREPITVDTPAAQACWPAPMPTRTEIEKERYRETVKRELPAFLHWLLVEWKMPSLVSGGRFVVRHWHHPQIVSELQELSPHMRLWELIVRSEVVFSHWVPDGAGGSTREWRKEWKGTASALEVLLKKDSASKLSDAEKKEIPSSNWLGKRLKLCEKHFGSGVCEYRATRATREWVLTPRGQDTGGAK